MGSVVGLITYEEKQHNTAASCQSQANVFDAEALGDLTEEAVDGERDNEKQVQVDESEGVAVGDADVTSDLAEPQPQGTVVGHFLSRTNVAESLQCLDLVSTVKYIYLDSYLVILTQFYFVNILLEDIKNNCIFHSTIFVKDHSYC